jgi:hypothetical protein
MKNAISYDVVVSVRASRYGWDHLIIYSYPTMALASECLFKAKAKGLVCWLRDYREDAEALRHLDRMDRKIEDRLEQP